MKRIFYYLLFAVLLFSCSDQKVLNEDMDIIIKKYIDDYELEASQRKTLTEHNIYLVIFHENKKDKNIEFSIFENIYFLKDKVSGHMTYKDNLVVFYGLNENTNDFVSLNQLSKKNIKNFHDDDSEKADIPYDPLIKKYIIKGNKISEVVKL